MPPHLARGGGARYIGGAMHYRLSLDDPRQPALALALASAGVLAAAFVFQYGFGYQPCVLCIWQRWPYACVLALSALLLLLGRRHRIGWALLAASGVALLVNSGIAFYHVGVEGHWWTGTPGCGVTGSALTIEDLRAQVMRAPVVRCDEVQWSLFGISMAGYNVVISLALAAFAFVSARAAYVHRSRGGTGT